MKISTVCSMAAALLLMLASCKSSSESGASGGETMKIMIPESQLDRALDQLDPQLSIMRLDEGDYRFSFNVGGGGNAESPAMRALRNIERVTFMVHAPDGNMIDSAATEEITASGIPTSEGSASLTVSASVVWKPDATLPDGAYVDMIVYTADGRVGRRALLPSSTARSRARPLHMTLDARERARQVEFVLTVRRDAPAPEGEYLPSGEKFRIELQNDVGETVWSSSRGMFFTQAIGPVEPTEVGEERRYTALWDGMSDITRSPLEAGVYRIVATIPAKPKPYILREEFTWSGR